ncbi:MAG: hypothetical protein AB1489_25840 [Acidobacteriota bacterium]
MAESRHHASEDRQVVFKYVLRLLALREAQQFEAHFAACDECATQLREVTHFFDLLQQALEKSCESVQGEEMLAEGRAKLPTLADIFHPPADLDVERLVTVFANCFAGFQKLCRNIAARMNPNFDMTQIEQAAIEILLALPGQVSKIQDL